MHLWILLTLGLQLFCFLTDPFHLTVNSRKRGQCLLGAVINCMDPNRISEYVFEGTDIISNLIPPV